MRKLTALFVAFYPGSGALTWPPAEIITTAALADAKPMHYKGKSGPHEDMMFKDLNLTDAETADPRNQGERPA